MLFLYTYETLVNGLFDKRHTPPVDWLAVREETRLESGGHTGQTLKHKQ